MQKGLKKTLSFSKIKIKIHMKTITTVHLELTQP